MYIGRFKRLVLIFDSFIQPHKNGADWAVKKKRGFLAVRMEDAVENQDKIVGKSSMLSRKRRLVLSSKNHPNISSVDGMNKTTGSPELKNLDSSGSNPNKYFGNQSQNDLLSSKSQNEPNSHSHDTSISADGAGIISLLSSEPNSPQNQTYAHNGDISAAAASSIEKRNINPPEVPNKTEKFQVKETRNSGNSQPSGESAIALEIIKNTHEKCPLCHRWIKKSEIVGHVEVELEKQHLEELEEREEFKKKMRAASKSEGPNVTTKLETENRSENISYRQESNDESSSFLDQNKPNKSLKSRKKISQAPDQTNSHKPKNDIYGHTSSGPKEISPESPFEFVVPETQLPQDSPIMERTRSLKHQSCSVSLNDRPAKTQTKDKRTALYDSSDDLSPLINFRSISELESINYPGIELIRNTLDLSLSANDLYSGSPLGVLPPSKGLSKGKSNSRYFTKGRKRSKRRKG